MMINNINNFKQNNFWLINNYINNCTNPLIFNNFEYFIKNNIYNNIPSNNEFYNSFIKELLINYFLLFEKYISNNSSYFSNISQFCNDCSSFNCSKEQIKELKENISKIYKYSCKSKHFHLNDEKKDKQNMFEN
jgi:hypothetical protein